MKSPLSRIDRGDSLAQQGMGLIIFAGWAITLSYFPSGALLFYFGSAVYLRDLALAAHITACLFWLYRTGDLRDVLRQAAILLLVPLFLIPAVADPNYRFEALRTVKWTFFWLDWIFIGHFAFHFRRWNQWLAIFITLTAAELMVEWIIGFYEWHVGHFLFSTPTTWDEKTIFGVQAVKEETIAGNIRVRGLQRDVFSFANLMAMSAVIGLALASFAQVAWQKAAGFGWAALFGVMLVVSGGRSALFGVFATSILAVAFAVEPRFTHRWSKVYVAVWVLIALVISFAGVGQLTDMISGTFFGKSYIGDSYSAYMRDDNWKNIIAAFEEDPIILIVGGPVSSLIESRIAPMFHWADNQFLWDTYHLGLAGSLAIMFYFFRVIWIGKAGNRPIAMDAICLFLLFVTGEAIARESLTFMGCLPLFIACGYVSAASTAPPDEHRHRSHRRRRREVQPPSELRT